MLTNYSQNIQTNYSQLLHSGECAHRQKQLKGYLELVFRQFDFILEGVGMWNVSSHTKACSRFCS